MTPSALKTVLLRAMARKASMTRDELIVTSQTVFGAADCAKITVEQILADMEDTGLVVHHADADGVLPTIYELTTHGQIVAKKLG